MRPDNATLVRLYDATKPPSEQMLLMMVDIVRRCLERGGPYRLTYDDTLLPAGVNAVLADYPNFGDSMDNLFGRIYAAGRAGIQNQFDKQMKEHHGSIQGSSTAK